MAENKTKPTGASVDDYLASKANDEQQADCRKLMTMLKRLTKQEPHMWGPTIVGYGSYKYKYASGRSGEAPLTGFAIRGRDLVIYIMAGSETQQALLAKLGKHKMGVSCLYFRRLADLDQSVLEQLVTNSMAEAKLRHG